MKCEHEKNGLIWCNNCRMANGYNSDGKLSTTAKKVLREEGINC